MMRHVVMDPSAQSVETGGGNTEQGKVRRTVFANAASLEDAVAITAEAIIEKLAKLPVGMQDKTDIDWNKQLQIYGVDSLLAVELRNWLVKEFKADITIFEIQGSATLGTLGVSIAVKSTTRNDE
jgi:acyl carrier protein